MRDLIHCQRCELHFERPALRAGGRPACPGCAAPLELDRRTESSPDEVLCNIYLDGATGVGATPTGRRGRRVWFAVAPLMLAVSAGASIAWLLGGDATAGTGTALKPVSEHIVADPPAAPVDQSVLTPEPPLPTPGAPSPTSPVTPLPDDDSDQPPAAARAPDSSSLARAALSRGHAMMLAGRDRDALAAYRRALLLAPDDPLAHRHVGVAMAALGDLQAALPHYRRYLELAPKAADAAIIRRIIETGAPHPLHVALGQ